MTDRSADEAGKQRAVFLIPNWERAVVGNSFVRGQGFCFPICVPKSLFSAVNSRTTNYQPISSKIKSFDSQVSQQYQVSSKFPKKLIYAAWTLVTVTVTPAALNAWSGRYPDLAGKTGLFALLDRSRYEKCTTVHAVAGYTLTLTSLSLNYMPALFPLTVLSH